MGAAEWAAAGEVMKGTGSILGAYNAYENLQFLRGQWNDQKRLAETNMKAQSTLAANEVYNHEMRRQGAMGNRYGGAEANARVKALDLPTNQFGSPLQWAAPTQAPQGPVAPQQNSMAPPQGQPQGQPVPNRTPQINF